MAHWINFRAAVGVGALIWSIAAVACVALKTWHGASAASNLITGALVCAMASLVFIRSPAIADSDQTGHPFQILSDSVPGLSDSCRSEATLGVSDNWVSDRSQGLGPVFLGFRSPSAGRRSDRQTPGVIVPSIRTGGERRRRTSNTQFAAAPVATRNGLTSPSE